LWRWIRVKQQSCPSGQTTEGPPLWTQSTNLTNEQKNPSSEKKRRVVLVAVLRPLGVRGSSLYISLFCRSQSSETGKTNSRLIPPLSKPRASCPNPIYNIISLLPALPRGSLN